MSGAGLGRATRRTRSPGRILQEAQGVKQRTGPHPAFPGGHGESQPARPQGLQQIHHPVDDRDLVGQPLALPDELLLHLRREAHDTHDLREIEALIPLILREGAGPPPTTSVYAAAKAYPSPHGCRQGPRRGRRSPRCAARPSSSLTCLELGRSGRHQGRGRGGVDRFDGVTIRWARRSPVPATKRRTTACSAWRAGVSYSAPTGSAGTVIFADLSRADEGDSGPRDAVGADPKVQLRSRSRWCPRP